MTREESPPLMPSESKAENVALQKQQIVQSNNTNNQEPDGFNIRIEAVVDQRDHLLQILFRKESEVQRLKGDKEFLEQQLKSAVKGKSEALAKLDLIEGKELNLLFKEKEMEMDKERLHNEVARLTEDLNTSRAELMAVRHDYLWATNQLQIDFNQHTEQLRVANSNICELSQTNQMLKSQNEEYASKLTEQINESSKLMEVYNKDLKAKVELVELYKSNCDDYQAHIKDLEAGVIQLQQLVNEAADECGILETKLNKIDEKHQIELNERDEIIANIRQELKHANILLGSDGNASDKRMDTEPDINVLDDTLVTEVGDIHLNKDITMTEMYNKYCAAVKELHNKQNDYNELEIETKNLYEGVQESAKKFNLLQLDNKKLKAANDKFIEDQKNLIVEKVVTRVKLEDTLILCDFLEKENKRLELYGSQSLDDNVKSNVTDSKRDSQYFLSELKEQNQTLLQLVSELYTKIEEMAGTETKFNLEIQELRDANENLIANRWIENAASTNVCHKSVGVSEYELMFGSDPSTDNPSIFQLKKNVQKIEEKLQSKIKELQELKEVYDAVQNEKRDLTAEKIKLSVALNVSNILNNGCNKKILILNEQSTMYVNTISEQKIAINLLTTEKINANQKLSAVENQCEHLHNECRKLTDAKKPLEIEVEILKKDLLQAKISIQILENKLEIAGEVSKRLQTQTQLKIEEKDKQMLLDRQKLQNEVERCQNIIAGMTRSSMRDISTETENIENESQDPVTFEITTLDDDSQTNKFNFLNTLQLEKSEKKVKRKLNSSSTSKRSRNEESLSSSLSSNGSVTRSQKRARVLLKDDTKINGGIGLPLSYEVPVIKIKSEEDQDEDVDVCDPNDEDYIPPRSAIELELRKEIRTRSQAHFLQNALHRYIAIQF